MNSKLLFTMLAFIVLAGNLTGQNLVTKKSKKYLDFYGDVSYSFSEIDKKPAGYLGMKLGLLVNQKWGFGIDGGALWYDHRLNKLSNTIAPYHLESGYTGIYAEYYKSLGKGLKLGIALTSGQGVVLYKYDNGYMGDMKYTEEVIDIKSFAILKPKAEILVQMLDRLWLGLSASYINTSPIRLIETNENLLNGFNYGFSINYGII